MRLSLGGGREKIKGFTNVDILDLPETDVVHNLIFIPYPFDDGSADEILCKDIVEHLPNYTPDSKPMIPAFMEEMYRILKHGGKLTIQTPGVNAGFAWTDPTHVRPFEIRSFDMFCPNTDFGKSTGFYSKARFEMDSKWEHENGNLTFVMVRI